MKKMLSVILATLFLSGCSATLPTAYSGIYQPRNYTLLEGNVLLGNFTYLPAQQGRLKDSQVENTAIGTLYLDKSIGDLAKEITAAELKHSGVTVGKGNIAILGDVKKLKLDDLGYSVDFSYTINYKITKNNSIIFSKDYSPSTITVSKFDGGRAFAVQNIYKLMGSGYDQFITDPEAKRILEQNK